MPISFNSSDGPSVGVEVELELVDRRTGELVSAASEILDEIGRGHPGGAHPRAKHELFECTVEIVTGVCGTAREAREDLTATLTAVQEAADRRGLAVMCSGTHPYSRPGDQVISPDPRYQKLVGEMQWMARRLQIFGVHVHVGVRSAEKVIPIANAMAGYIPHLLALSASSPYWEGQDTGLASSRAKVFEGLPTAGLPPTLEDWTEFEGFVDTLVTSRAISTIREVWWDIRPHPDFGTVELRMCDGMPTLTEVTAVAALGQSLVAWLDHLLDRGYQLPRHRDWILQQNKWRAGRHGIDAELIVDDAGSLQPLSESVVETLEELEPIATRLGCATELAGVHRILEVGPSYLRQRAAAGTGDAAPDLRAVVDHLVEELAAGCPRAVAR